MPEVFGQVSGKIHVDAVITLRIGLDAGESVRDNHPLYGLVIISFDSAADSPVEGNRRFIVSSLSIIRAFLYAGKERKENEQEYGWISVHIQSNSYISCRWV